MPLLPQILLVTSRAAAAFAPLRSIKCILAAVVLCSQWPSVMAQAPKSLLPAFGNDGGEFTTKAQGSHVTKGWLPTEWKDNSEWAPVTATYTKLTDAPDKGAGAVRITIEKVDEGGQLQLTTYSGNQKYKKGVRYVVTGWVRSPGGLALNVGLRQTSEPYEFYHEQELATGTEWKQFEFAFTPTKDFTAFLMFFAREAGVVDLSGVSLEEKS